MTAWNGVNELFFSSFSGGVRGIARGGIAGLTLTGLYALYNNWEHMKGSIARQSLWAGQPAPGRGHACTVINPITARSVWCPFLFYLQLVWNWRKLCWEEPLATVWLDWPFPSCQPLAGGSDSCWTCKWAERPPRQSPWHAHQPAWARATQRVWVPSLHQPCCQVWSDACCCCTIKAVSIEPFTAVCQQHLGSRSRWEPPAATGTGQGSLLLQLRVSC